ncbi:outer membrane protein [Vibrio vulnificus]|uniref:outer membrane protein n=1 Tax=Vibrio vulnificus TaxID=672 RepID=UPI001028AA4F|nr:outer membrane beta-barrel protein [Vibrio vulnificus]RZP84635.1 hypothetical protein D8T54_24530 [Vibrio vulnificus]RZR36260.1 hypothetical protein D8T58_24545 [Vibrio vulnificus]
MRKTVVVKNGLYLLIALAPSIVLASPYLGVSIEPTIKKSSVETHYQFLNETPEDSSLAFGLNGGYRFDYGTLDNFGFEIGYKYLDVSDSAMSNRDLKLGYTAHQYLMKPTYYYTINQQSDLKVGMGLSYSTYDFESSLNQTKKSLTKNGFGVITTLGIESDVTDNLTLGVGLFYQVDDIAQSYGFAVGTSYHFL